MGSSRTTRPLPGFGVPNANLIYKNDREMEQAGSIHYASHVHDPYDTLDLVREMGDVLEQMARVPCWRPWRPGSPRPTCARRPSRTTGCVRRQPHRGDPHGAHDLYRHGDGFRDAGF